MKSIIKLIVLIVSVNLAGFAQVPSPMGSTGGSLSWTKTGSSSYTLRDISGNVMTSTQKLNRLKTDTLTYLDKSSRTIYLLPDCVDAAEGTSGKLKVLVRNVGSDFYITNQKSFVTYINDESYQGSFVNVNGSYIYYLEEFGRTFYHDGIRSFSGWGAKNISTLELAPGNVYWYRNTEKGEYGVIVKGETLDYDRATTEKDGNDMILKMDGVKTYRFPGYYTMASFIIKPAKLYSSTSTSTNSAGGSVGCVTGNCNDGWGKWQYDSGYYEGFWMNGKKQGYGLYKWEGLGKYIGNWNNDAMSGYGAYLAENEDNIIGEYKNGKLNGRGYQVIGEEWSQGWYTDGNLTDEYSYYRNDVDMGCTSGDCENEYGYFKWSNGDHFVGFFKNGKMYFGTYTFADGNKYSGMFNSSNQYHGTGRFFFLDDSYYGGEWRDGKYHGKGYYHDEDYEQQIGEWSYGVLVKNYK